MNWMKYRWLYLLISLTVIGAGMFSLIKWGLNIGVDFKGGALLEYKFNKEISTEEATRLLDKSGIQVTSVQKSGTDSYIFRTSPISQTDREKARTVLTTLGEGNADELRYENVGPSIGPDIIRKTIYGMIISASAIFSGLLTNLKVLNLEQAQY